MGFKNKRKDVFRPRELKEENVQAIIGECRGQDGNWDEQALGRHRADIRYLLGQLAPAQQGVKECKVDASCFARYSGANWTEDPSTFFDLCSMGAVFGYCALDKRDGQYFLTLDGELKPTLSPRDPGFIDWVDTADGLAVRLQYAMDNGAPPEELLPLCEKAAEQDNTEAQFKCGSMYENGEGTAADKVKALYWYEKAAEQGHAEAQFNCGSMYSKGEGTAVDKSKALQWYEKAAEQGYANAQFVCGGMYRSGKGAAVDKARALYWYEKAAEQGNSNAQYNCGVMYYEGEGTARDLAKAKGFFQKVAAQTEDAVTFVVAKHYLEQL